MADPLDALTPKQRAIIKQLGDLEVSLENGMAGALPKVFATLSRDVQRVAANLSIDPNDRAKTLRELIGLKRKIGDLVVNNPEYQREVLKLTNEFKTIKNLTDQFIGSTMDDFEPTRKLYNAILESNIAITKDALLGGGIVDNFGNAIQEVLKANIAGVSDRATLMETLAKFIEGTPQRKGYLENYIKQTTNDSLMVFNREYLQTISEDLGMRHYLYQGTIIGDTRQFCQSKAGKYFTKEEVEKWASQTWDGKMAGTNSTTIFSYAGGYNCRHKIWPVTEEQYNRAKGITPPAAIPPSPPVVARPPAIPPQMTATPVLPKPIAAPKPPKGFAGDTSGLPKTTNGLKKYINDSFEKNLGLKFSQTIVAREHSIEMFQEQVAAIDKLTKMYRVDGETHASSKLVFKSKKDYFGNVTYGSISSGTLPIKKVRIYTDANFGHEFSNQQVLSRLPKNVTTRPFTLVDEVNERIATSVHEFAHFISQSRAIPSQFQSKPFWDEMRNIYSNYKQTLQVEIRELSDVRTKKNEFAANYIDGLKNLSDVKTKLGEASIEYQNLSKELKNIQSNLQKTSEEFVKLEESFQRNYLGDYSQTNVDEFLAEGFTNYHLHSRPSKWASEIGKLVNKYFKK